MIDLIESWRVMYSFGNRGLRLLFKTVLFSLGRRVYIDGSRSSFDFPPNRSLPPGEYRRRCGQRRRGWLP